MRGRGSISPEAILDLPKNIVNLYSMRLRSRPLYILAAMDVSVIPR